MATDNPNPTEEWTLHALRDWTRQYLKDKGMASAERDAEVLLAHVLGCSRIQLYVRFEEVATPEVRTTFKALLKKRVEGCPVDYLVGTREFYQLRFEVNSSVLIPREDTTVLVMEALTFIKQINNPIILDVGTGSGCIAITIAKQHPHAELTAIDLSPKALEVAQRNAATHQVGARIRFLQGDLLAPLAADQQFDLIVSNPPYIAPDEMPSLPTEVRDFEPRLALEGGGLDGLDVYRRLIPDALRHLKPGGSLMVEIGYRQEQGVRDLFAMHPGLELARTVHDLAMHPRVIKARWNPVDASQPPA